ncbi:uncharacterized protein [Anoplolepis gracilipes]|uniref:uncharacterized protein isoform X2 n=1 Tax=Anoplolepis gracilipes TaxID=354296 RepID=UPI003B9F4542
METMELYKRLPANGYKELAGYHRGDFCYNCGQNEYEDALRGIVTRKRRTRKYEKHCPLCHCPLERRRSPSGGPRTLENVEATLNRYERIFAEPVTSVIKKSQSSPLSQKIYWHNCQTGAHSRCPRRSLQQTRRQRRLEHDKYLCRMKGDAMNSELMNEDIEASKYAQSVPIKSSLKRHSHCREPEGSPDEYSEAESEVSTKYASRLRQKKREEKESRVTNPQLGSRHHQGVGGDGEYIAEMRSIESDVDCRRNAHDYQEQTRKLVLELEELERLKMKGDGEATAVKRVNDDNRKLDRRKHDVVVKTTKQKRSGDGAVSSEPSVLLIKESIDGSTKKLNKPTHLANLDLHATKTRILESIDHILGTMDDTKNDAPVQQEETEQETIEKITRELQENGWQLLFNALTIHRNSTDSGKRTVRLECLNHIRQQLDKLYALESTLDNCPLKLQSLSNNDVSCNEEHQQTQQLEHKIADS